MEKQKNFKEKGITLIALIITVIILLILAGISITSLTNSGLFEKAREAEAKSKNAQNQENSILAQYENIMNSYLNGTGGISSEKNPSDGEDEETSVTLASKVNIGDYVEYTPAPIDEKTHNDLITELAELSGNTDTAQNTTSTIKQEKPLNWRVLDIIEDDKSGYLIKDNNLNEYATKLKTLMQDESLRAKMGAKSKEIVKSKFSKDVVMKQWENLFKKLKSDK